MSITTEGQSPKKQFFFSRIFPLIFILVGAGITFVGVRNLVRANESTEWPSVPGKILQSSVESRKGSSTGKRKRSKTTYHAEIEYKFTVDKEIFTGDRVSYGDYGSGDSSHAREIVNRYPQGKEVTVFYMPENPDESLLEPGLKGQTWILPIVGLIFFITGCLLAFFMGKSIRKKAESQQVEHY